MSSTAPIFSSRMPRNDATSSMLVKRSENVRMHSCAHSRTMLALESHTFLSDCMTPCTTRAMSRMLKR